MLTQYKGTREAAPEELISQIPLIQDMLEAFGVTYVTKQGYEGDDVIATLATMGEHADYRTYVLSGDRDAFQLIDDDITVLYPGYHFKELKAMTPQAPRANTPIWPHCAVRPPITYRVCRVWVTVSPPSGSTNTVVWTV